MAGKIPILGVCLGHQIIGHVFRAKVKKVPNQCMERLQNISSSKALFDRLPESYTVTRYHSLIVSDENFPDILEIDARSEDGIIMGIHHKTYHIYGVQFHPEAVLTEYGHELLETL